MRLEGGSPALFWAEKERKKEKNTTTTKKKHRFEGAPYY